MVWVVAPSQCCGMVYTVFSEKDVPLFLHVNLLRAQGFARRPIRCDYPRSSILRDKFRHLAAVAGAFAGAVSFPLSPTARLNFSSPAAIYVVLGQATPRGYDGRILRFFIPVVLITSITIRGCLAGFYTLYECCPYLPGFSPPPGAPTLGQKAGSFIHSGYSTMPDTDTFTKKGKPPPPCGDVV